MNSTDYYFVDGSRAGLISHVLAQGAVVTDYSTVKLAALATLFLVLLSGLSHTTKLKYSFFNANGKSMKRLPGDTRFTRFSHGADISKKGFEMAPGEPVLINNGWTSEIILSTPEHMQDFFTGDARDHLKAPNLNMGHYFGRLLGNSAGVQNGERWRLTRAHFDPSFSHMSATHLRPRFLQEIGRWLQELPGQAYATEQGSGHFAVDAVTACRVLPFKLIACACYGELLNDTTFAKLLKLNEQHEELMLRSIFGRKTTSAWYNKLPTQDKQQMDRYQQDWKAFNDDVLQAADQTGLACPMTQVRVAVTEGLMSELDFLHTIDEILFTNVDVTSAVLAFLLLNLAANQDCQDDVRAEMAEKLGPEPSPGQIDDYLNESSTLLEYTCLESTRLCPATWFSLPEMSPNDKWIGGYKVKAGTPIVIDWKRLNTQSPVWNPPGEGSITGLDFEPRRFRQLQPKQYRYSLLRFGIGPRKCIGKNMSGVLMKIFLIKILGAYKLELDDDGSGCSEPAARGGKKTPTEFEIREDRFTVTPKQSVRFVKF